MGEQGYFYKWYEENKGRHNMKVTFNTGILIATSGLFLLQGCTILREFPRRSEVTFKAQAGNPVDAKEGARTLETTLELKGNNRDILNAYKNALEFTLEQFGLKKK